MDWLELSFSIYISIVWGSHPIKAKSQSINAGLAAVFNQLVQNLVLYTPIHSFVVIRSQHLKWQK